MKKPRILISDTLVSERGAAWGRNGKFIPHSITLYNNFNSCLGEHSIEMAVRSSRGGRRPPITVHLTSPDFAKTASRILEMTGPDKEKQRSLPPERCLCIVCEKKIGKAYQLQFSADGWGRAHFCPECWRLVKAGRMMLDALEALRYEWEGNLTHAMSLVALALKKYTETLPAGLREENGGSHEQADSLPNTRG